MAHGRRTALHVAAMTHNLRMTQLLIEYGADVHRQDFQMETPLHYAAWAEDVLLVHELLAAMADAMAEDRDGCSPLVVAQEADVRSLLMNSCWVRLSQQHVLHLSLDTLCQFACPVKTKSLCRAFNKHVFLSRIMDARSNSDADDDLMGGSSRQQVTSSAAVLGRSLHYQVLRAWYAPESILPVQPGCESIEQQGLDDDVLGGASQEGPGLDERIAAELETQVDCPAVGETKEEELGDGDRAGIVGPPPLEDDVDMDESTWANLRKRRFLPGALTSEDDFQSLFGDLSIREKFPAYSDRMIRLSTAALAIFCLRTQDMHLREHALFLWIVEGGKYLRFHDGDCYMLHCSGAFQRYKGVPADSSRLHEFLLQLEGIFRKMPEDVKRDEIDLLDAIHALWADAGKNDDEFGKKCVRAAVSNVGENCLRKKQQDEDEASLDSDPRNWRFHAARVVWQLKMRLSRELTEEKLLHYMIEWCETAKLAMQACCFEDCTVEYASSGAYDDIWRDGVFPKDPSLKEFLISGPALLAALQIQNAFEMRHCQHDCEEMIENYAYWGGDNGLTEQTMREACDMPPRDLRDIRTRAASVIVLGDDALPQDPADQWAQVLQSLVEHLLAARRLDFSADYFKKIKLQNLPNMNKEELLDGLQANGVILPSAARTRSKQNFVPAIASKAGLSSLVAYENRQHCPTLPERFAAQAFKNYVSHHPCRLENSEVLAAVYKNIASQPSAQAGRPSSALKCQKEESLEKASKIESHEAMCASMLKRFKEPAHVSSQSSPGKLKRRKCKGPPEVEVKQEGSSEVKQEGGAGFARSSCLLGWKHESFRYAYPLSTSLRTRKIVEGVGAQKFTRRAQVHLLASTHDLDIHNSVFTLFRQLLDKLRVKPSMPETLRATLVRCADHRDEVCARELGMSKSRGKKILTSVLYGGSLPAGLGENDFLINLSKVSLFFRWLAISLLTEEFNRFMSPDINKKNPENSILAHLYLALEDCVLSSWCDHLLSMQPEHLSLHFDGVRVSTFENHSVEEICQSSEKHIENQTGFCVKILEKQHQTVLQQVRACAEEEIPSMSAGNSLLEKMGNCIPAALASLQDKDRISNLLAGEAEQPMARSYRQCEALCNVKLVPCLEFAKVKTGIFLFHSESGGMPHCVSLHIDEDGSLPIWAHDVGCSYKIKQSSLEDALEAGVDSSTCVFFQVFDEKDEAPLDQYGLRDADARRLLNLEAAGLKRPAGAKRPANLKKKAVGAKKGSEQLDVDRSQPCSSTAEMVPSLKPSNASGESAVMISSSPSEAEIVDLLSDEEDLADKSQQDRCVEDTGAPGELWLDDDAVVTVDSALLRSLAEEVSVHIQKGRYKMAGNKFACPLCPWRCFQQPGRVKEHLARYHVKKNQFCCSGTKQLKCVLSLHDSDMLAAARQGNYLSRSAELLRQQVQPPLSGSVNSIDKEIRLVLDSTGPRFVNRKILGDSLIARRNPFNARKAEREEAPFHGKESVNRVITVRGRTGAVVAMFAAPGEGADDIQQGLAQHFSVDALHQTLYVASDAPSYKLFAALRQIMPNLVALSLDPVHLSMHYESSSGRKKTAGSAALRRCMAKFCNQDASALSENRQFFTQQATPFSSAEKAFREQILDGSMSETRARGVLRKSEHMRVWACRKAFLEHLAAISSCFWSEMTKKSEEGKPLYKLLWNATEPDRLGYLFNNLLIRTKLSSAEHVLLPTGTTSNESLHAELNGWFRQTQSLHKSTLDMKLHILGLAKLLSHNASLYSPTARQMFSSHVLARRLGAGLWTVEAWREWVGHNMADKPQLPIQKRRKEEAQKVKAFLAKKPACQMKRPCAKVHRTPFNLVRSQGLKRAGVHRRPSEVHG
eukprot:Skav206833  [mRNA]  locus=scaffold3672:167985:175192:- [translate_table: standard]